MEGYSHFSEYYDQLMQAVDYHDMAKDLGKRILEIHPNAKLVLDLGCGTGSLLYELMDLGFDMIGLDASSEMLSIALNKGMERDLHPLLLCQSMEEMDLYGTIEACVCTLDTLNHVDSFDAFQKVLERVHLFLEPNGVFIFDMNSTYKHRCVLGNHDFVYEVDDLLCAWQNHYDSESDRVEISLDFFVKQHDGTYLREHEEFTEIAFSQSVIMKAVASAGFELVEVLDADTKNEPVDTSERLLFICKKE